MAVGTEMTMMPTKLLALSLFCLLSVANCAEKSVLDDPDIGCLKGMETVYPHEVEKAARLFHRDGFVVVLDALSPEKTSALSHACDVIMNTILQRDPLRLGNRGPRRWTLGSVSKTGHLLHIPEWADVVDNERLFPMLDAIFGNDKYLVRGARGDFNLPGSPWQELHSDTWKAWLTDPAPTEYPDSGRLNEKDLPLFYLVVNYNVIDVGPNNAPVRHVPMTQNSHRTAPSLEDEPAWMLSSRLCPLPKGSAIVRDPRAWHGGTPNRSNGTRCMPNVEYYAYWFRFHDNQQMTKSLPQQLYSKLSPRGQHMCREVITTQSATDLAEEEADIDRKAVIVYEDHLEEYRALGLDDSTLKEIKASGRFSPSIGTVAAGKAKQTTDDNNKDEL